MGKAKSRISVGNLRLDKDRFEVNLAGSRVRLTPKEFGLLWALAAEVGKVFRREELLGKVWGAGLTVGLRTIDAHIKKLRKKLCASPSSPSCIETVRGVGYRFNSEPMRRG